MADADIEDGKRLLENRYMLDAMQIESRRWPKVTEDKVELDTKFMIPQTVLNY